MLRFGVVSKINPALVQARVYFGDDESTSYWLPVLQTKTLKDKFYVMPDIGEQVACLMDKNSEDGVILGAIYSNVDKSIINSEKKISMNLEDGSSINADKENKTLTVVFKTMKLIGNIEHYGILKNTDGIESESSITSEADVIDKTSSMQDMREIFNSHTHTGNLGVSTSQPDKGM